MKKCLLFCTITMLLSGCIHLFHEHRFYGHEVTITLKDGVPCFGLADDEQRLSEQYNISTVSVTHNSVGQLPKIMMNKRLENNTLKPGQCIPYDGEPLKSDFIYGIDFGGYFAEQHSGESHGYAGTFRLIEKKGGKKEIQHFKFGEQPTPYPVSGNE